jgi:MFS family permease
MAQPARGASKPATIPPTDPGPAQKRGPFYALTFRNFRLFFVGQLVSVAGTWMQSVAQQWLVYDLTHSAAWLGIVTGASALPYVVFAVWGGQAADRYPRRLILVWTQVAAMALAFVLALLVTGWWIPIRAWHIAVLAGLLGIVNAFNMPAQQAFVSELVDDQSALGNAIALNSLRFNVARFVGPVLAGIVLVKMGAAACFVLNGLSYIAVIASLLMLSLPEHEPPADYLSPWAGFAFVWRSPSVLRVTLLVAAASLFGWSASTLYPVFAGMFGRGAQGFSTIMAVNGVGAALGGLAVAVFGERVHRRLLVYGGAVLFAVSLLWLAGAHSFTAALACIFFGGVSMIVFAITSNTKIQEDAPPELRGRVMAVYSLVFNACLPVGGLQIGYLAEHLGTVTAVRLDAALCLILALGLFGWSEIEVRQRR